MVSRARRLLEAGALAVRPLPVAWACAIADRAGRLVASRVPGKRRALADNLRRVVPSADEDELDALALAAFGSYGRYWAETLKLPRLSPAAIEAAFDVEGYEHIQRSIAGGVGPVMVLPHLGGWEWAAAWLGRVAELPVSAVVEPLEPDDVFEWFRELRESYGVNVIPLGPEAMGHVVRAVRDRHIVCLLADRDLAESGVEVTFFGATTTLPAGPALLARRTGAPLLPTGVFHTGERRRTHLCRIAPPIEWERTGSIRHDVVVVTQAVAHALERLIESAPEQWHVLEPIWPSPPTN